MVVVSPDGEYLVTANLGTQNLSVIERASGELVTQIPCGRGGEGMTFTPDGRELWVANQDEGTITVVEWGEGKIERGLRRLLRTRTIPCPGMPLRIRFTADGRLALVSDWRERGHLVVLETATGREVKRIPLGNQPIGVELPPDGRRCFVTNMTSDEIHVVDMGTLEVSAVFHTGRGCDAMAWWSPPA